MSSSQDASISSSRKQRPFAIPIREPTERVHLTGQDEKSENSELSPKSMHDTFSSSDERMPDISKLRASGDDEVTHSWGMHVPYSTTGKNDNNSWSYHTPRRFSIASSLARSSSPTPGLVNTPFTPRSSFTADSQSTPITPYTPAFHFDSRRPSMCSESMAFRGETAKEIPEATYTAETIDRYMLITNIPRDVSEFDFRDMVQSVAEFKALIVKHLKSKGCVIVAFHDPRENFKLYKRLQSGPVDIGPSRPMVDLQSMPISRDVVETVTGHGGAWDQVWKTSESTVKIDIHGGHPMAVDVMERVMSAIGPVLQIEPMGFDGKAFAVGFYDTRDAAQAIAALNGQTAGQALLCVDYLKRSPHDPSPVQSSAQRAFSLGSAAYTPGSLSVPRSESASSDVFRIAHSPDGSLNLRTPSSTSLNRLRAEEDLFSSRSSSFTPSKRDVSTPVSSHSLSAPWSRDVSAYSEYDGTPPRILSLSRRLSEAGTVQGLVNRADIAARARQRQGLGGHWEVNDRKAIPEQNRVFPERIMAGLDSRTTVMVKDVPNKLSRQELVAVLNEVVPGEFDFVYLRFDFKNCCNVGYAFVNFCSVRALLKFIQARVGKKWNMFSSEKILQLSYADIQGKSALINKFRNSAVMGVIESWRPQIFYSSGALKGQAEPFPESDNLAVRERSTSAQIASYSNQATKSPFGLHDRAYEYSNGSFDHGF